jgi:hypothetical protein
MTLYKNDKDIFQILDAIEKKTGLFLLNQNLDYLYSFISGYFFLADGTKTEIINREKFDKFSSFLQKEFNEDTENAMGWFGQLHSEFGSIEGFKKFYEYLHKFRSQDKC